MKRRAIAILAVAFVASACAASLPEVAPYEPLTYDQAVRLSQVLTQNYLQEAATFTLTATDFLTTDTFTLEGIVNWHDGHGRAVVTGITDEYGELLEVAWTRDAVAEYRPELVSLLVARNEPPDTFFLRPLAQDQRRLDRLLQLLLRLASPNPENAQLLLQQDSAGFLGSETVNGDTVERLQYSAQSVYWVSIEDGVLRRFDGNDETGNAPFTVVFHLFGPQRVTMPVVSTEAPLPLTR